MVTDQTVKPIEVLLVEDNSGDIRLTQEALEESRLLVRLTIVRDGMEAMAYLRREGAHGGVVTPDLILLDLNLPKKDGREVLQEINTDPELRKIPVAVLTASETESDMLASTGLYADCYVTKPVDMEQFIKIVKVSGEFWFTIVRRPSQGA